MSKDNLEDLVQLLNFKLGKGKSGHECLVKFLRDIGLVEFQTRFSTDKHNYSLFSREEVEAWVKTMGDNAPTEIRQLTFALNKEKNLTSEGDFSTTIFPEDSLHYGGAFRAAFEVVQSILWEFIGKLDDGYVDIAELNKHLWDQESIFEFKPTKNPLKPAITIQRMIGRTTLERAVFDKYIYPKIFTGQTQDLVKILRCRNCRTYFLGKRLSAVFCSDKCRGAFHHANT